MAERKRCQGLNSKCFLVTYLVIVSFLLVLWFTRTGLLQKDLREIPTELQAYITSPPRQINEYAATLNEKQVLTNSIFGDKWTIVYFSHANCVPSCFPAFKKLAAFQSAHASQDIKVIIINLDSDDSKRGKLAELLRQNSLDFPILEVEKPVLEILTKVFVSLYLTTEFTDGTYQIEQQHDLFLVDPKSRVYAVFDDKTSSAIIHNNFVSLRQFYAKSE